MRGMATLIHPPRHLVWSTDTVDLSDPFQRKWYVRQILVNGRAADLKSLDLDELSLWLDDLNLPAEVVALWRAFLEARRAAKT